MKTDAARLLVILAILGLASTAAVRAQTASTPATVDFYLGDIKQPFLPYGMKFVLKGSTSLPEGDARLIQLTVSGPDVRHKTMTWKPSRSGDNSSFAFPLGPFNGWRKEYRLELKFYVGVESSTLDGIVHDIVESTKARVVQDYEQRSWASLDLTRKYFEEAVEAKKTEYAHKPFHFINEAGAVQKGFPLPDIGKILGMSTLEMAATKDTSKLKDKIAAASVVVLSVNHGSLFDKLRKVAQSDKNVDPADIEKLISSARKPELGIDGPLTTRLGYLQSGEALTKGEQRMLAELLNRLLAIDQDERKLKGALEKFSRFEAGMKKLSGTLSDIYQLQSVYEVTAGVNRETGMDKLLIGTAYGFGVTRLGAKDGEFDSFGYVALKFYFDPVDYSALNPYPGSHFAVTLGAVFASAITYKGQQQSDLLSGMKPMLGLSYDIQPTLVFNAGCVFFRQPSVNLLAPDRKRMKLAPYFGMTLDFDAFNRLRTLMKSSQTN